MTTRHNSLAFDRRSFRNGIRAALPLALPPIPFAMAFGLLVAETPEVPDLAGWSSSWMLFAGSAQLVSVQLLGDGAGVAVIIASVAMLNARHIVYSAAVSQRLGTTPWWFRIIGSYLLIDQVFAIEDTAPSDMQRPARAWLMLGAGLTFFVIWMAGTTVGVIGGDALPDDFPIGFVVALLFASLMVLAINGSPGLVAALVGGAVALAARDLPAGSGLMLAIVLGAAAGAAVEGRNP